jgi:lysophospholipase L1-like esterase
MRELTVAVLAVLACAAGAFGAESPDCAVAGHLVGPDYPLERVAAAMDQRRELTIAVVGAGSSSLAGDPSLAYPAQLQRILTRQLPDVKTKLVVNVKSRRTAGEMRKLFEKILMDDKPDLVIWQSGTFDAIAGVDPDEYRTALEDGIETLHDGGADVVLMNMQYSPRTETMIAIQAYADNMRLVSQQWEAPLMDRFAVMKHWGELGTFDFYKATKKLEMAARIHECIAELLADLIREGARLSREQPNPVQ